MPLRLLTWNINSVRLRIDLLARLVAEQQPDIICLQETKCIDALFPHDACRAMGFGAIEINGQAGYHGVATLSRLPLRRISALSHCGTGQARHLATEVSAAGQTVEIHNVYVPAGGDIPDAALNRKFALKLRYLETLALDLARCRSPAVLLGDFNVAPLPNDVWSHRQLLRVVSHTPIEVERLATVQASRAWVDVIRRDVCEDEKLYSWWSYRAKDWAASDRGRRLDHIWLTPDIAPLARQSAILKPVRGWPRTSDHVPVMVDLQAAG